MAGRSVAGYVYSYCYNGKNRVRRGTHIDPLEEQYMNRLLPNLNKEAEG